MVVAPSDCAYGSTSPNPAYNPTTTLTIPVVVHVIQNSSGTGFISAALVQSQIDILNEDFLAMAGTLGAPGTNSEIQFELASTDPAGNPTSGITYTTNTSWYNDSGSYWNSLSWDTNNYLNIYTNSAGGFLGYVPDIPQGGIVGSASDRVVVYWASFGRNGPIGPPYNKGRTTTHEVGHYLGLYHTFDGGCGAGSCYTSGDRICDTNPESSSTLGCPGSKSSCGSADPFHNYMDYTDDICMWEFSPEQANRMRCTLENWRPALANTGGPPPTGSAVSLNIDIGSNTTFPVPGSGYGAAASQAGTWNGVAGNAVGQALLATDGSASGVTISVSGGNGSFEFNNASTTGNVERILDDIQDAGASTWTLNGLASGTYTVYLYSWAPDDPTGFTSGLNVVGGSAGLQICGGAGWTGGFVNGSHFVTDTVSVTGGTITIQVSQIAGAPSSLNAIQIVALGGSSGPGTAFCFGDGGGTACPCGNSAGAAEGCGNSNGPGAEMTGSGSNSASTGNLVLSTTGLIAGQPGLYFQGNNAVGGGNGVIFGDGLRCAGGSTVRLQVVTANGAGASSTSLNIAAAGGAAAGQTRRYQLWYRDPTAGPCLSGFNLSGGYEVVWTP